jgi:hypothetical protein
MFYLMQKIKRVTTVYLWRGFIVLSPMNRTVSLLHYLPDEGLSVLGGVSMDVSLGLHTFFFLVAGVVVDLED